MNASKSLPNLLVTPNLRAQNPSNPSVNAVAATAIVAPAMFPVSAKGTITNGATNLDAVNKFGICFLKVFGLFKSLNAFLISCFKS